MNWLVLLVIVPILIVGNFAYFAWYLRWESRSTTGMAYYGRSLAERRALKKRIRQYSLAAKPLVGLLAILMRKRASMPVFEYEGVCGPPKVSSPEVFKRAKNYRPGPEDVFVATQMRCGTTWMQQLVYEIVHRGRGDLSDSGHGPLYAVCPWIDGINSVSLTDAPLIGERPTRVIKTHLPAKLCPYSERAKYIYVTRHPASCFASLLDYNRSLLGPLMPRVDKMADWFCSDRMYWLPWPEHVAGWWEWAQNRENVLFVHFEEMAENFSRVLDRVEHFLSYELTASEKQRISEKCSFQYMKDNEELFEMAPPNMFSVNGGRFLLSGNAARYNEVELALRQQILDYCRESLRESNYPAQHFYPDLALKPVSDVESEQCGVLVARHD